MRGGRNGNGVYGTSTPMNQRWYFAKFLTPSIQTLRRRGSLDVECFGGERAGLVKAVGGCLESVGGSHEKV